MLLFSHHMPIPLQPASLPFLCASPHFIGPTCYLIAYFVQFRLRPQIIYFRVPSSLSISLPPYTSAGLTAVLCISPLVFTFIFLSHNTPATLYQFFHPLCTLWVTSGPRYPSSATIDPTFVNIFTLLLSLSMHMYLRVLKFTAPQVFSLLSTNLQSSLFHCSSPFLKPLFYLFSSSTTHHYVVCKQRTPIGLLFDAQSHHIQYHVKQVW